MLAGFLAAMTYWLYLASIPPANSRDGKSRHDPDYMVEKFEVRRFDQEGTLQSTLRAGIMRHYPDDDSTIVLAPDLTYHRLPPTYIIAREAKLDSGAKHVALIDDVRMIRGGPDGKLNSVLTTTQLDVYPDDEIATTTRPVTITQGLTNINGSGLQANNKTGISVLEGPVHGIFHRDGGAPRVAKPSTTTIATPKPAPVSKPVVKSKPVPKPQPAPKTKPKTQPKP
jgi:lipopolysaccharide export system protein LptC